MKAAPSLLTRALLSCGVVAGPVFVSTFLLEGAARKDYSPLQHPVSALALSGRGWVQVTNFCVAGTLFRVYSAATAPAMFATGALAGAGFSQVPRFVRLAGAFQRVSIILGFSWLTALFARAL